MRAGFAVRKRQGTKETINSNMKISFGGHQTGKARTYVIALHVAAS